MKALQNLYKSLIKKLYADILSEQHVYSKLVKLELWKKYDDVFKKFRKCIEKFTYKNQVFTSWPRGFVTKKGIKKRIGKGGK